MWIDGLEKEERKMLNMIAGALSLPELDEYASKAHFLTDVYSRVLEARSLARQLNKLLGILG